MVRWVGDCGADFEVLKALKANVRVRLGEFVNGLVFFF